MKRIMVAFICVITALTLTGCGVDKSVNVNIKNNSSISGKTFGKSALVEIGDYLWYDTTTRIVYLWNGALNCNDWSITPSPYYAPNGLPYRYNPETNTFEEIQMT